MTINWFPGHMNRARRELAEAIAQIDVVIELLDARLPRASRNPLLAELRGDRPCLVLLGKRDLADPDVTKAWRAHFDAQGTPATDIDAGDRGSVKGVPQTCRKLAPHRRGPGKPVRCMVVGIPNVGKSTLINTLLGRRIAKVEDRPAVTRRQQQFRLAEDISLADTPGVLWPKLADQAGAYRLALSGAVGEAAFDTMDVALFGAKLLAAEHGAVLAQRYKLDTIPDAPEAILEAIGRKRGFLMRGGVVDMERAADTLLRELRSGAIGRISFEHPDDALAP